MRIELSRSSNTNKADSQHEHSPILKPIKWLGRKIKITGYGALHLLQISGRFAKKMAIFPFKSRKVQTFHSLYGEKKATKLNGWDTFTQNIRVNRIIKRVILNKDEVPINQNAPIGSHKDFKVNHYFVFVNKDRIDLTVKIGGKGAYYTISRLEEAFQVTDKMGRALLIGNIADMSEIMSVFGSGKTVEPPFESKKKPKSAFAEMIEDRKEYLDMDGIHPLFLREFLHQFYSSSNDWSYISNLVRGNYYYMKRLSSTKERNKSFFRGVVIYPARMHNQVNIAAKYDLKAQGGKSPKFHFKEGDYILALRKKYRSKHAGLNVTEFVISQEDAKITIRYLHSGVLLTSISASNKESFTLEFNPLLEKLKKASKVSWRKKLASDFSKNGVKYLPSTRKWLLRAKSSWIEASQDNPSVWFVKIQGANLFPSVMYTITKKGSILDCQSVFGPLYSIPPKEFDLLDLIRKFIDDSKKPGATGAGNASFTSTNSGAVRQKAINDFISVVEKIIAEAGKTVKAYPKLEALKSCNKKETGSKINKTVQEEMSGMVTNLYKKMSLLAHPDRTANPILQELFKNLSNTKDAALAALQL